MRRLTALTLVAVLVAGLLAPAGAAATPWDRHFQTAAKRWFAGALDWRWFVAQAMAESSLDPAAVSPVGALGLMQLMPGTSKEVADRLGLPDRPRDPRVAIALGVAYDRQLWRFWSSPRPNLERLRLTLASYNAGPGSVHQAQKLAQAAGLPGVAWADMAIYLPQVTGHHSKETIGYVDRIQRLYKALSLRAID